MRRADGKPLFDGSAPFTVTVTAWWAPRSTIAIGAPCIAHAPLIPNDHALARVLDHVVAWSGLQAGSVDPSGTGALACTRSNVKAILRSYPAFVQQLVDAINAVTTSGIVS